jgi:hypothetical protein
VTGHIVGLVEVAFPVGDGVGCEVTGSIVGLVVVLVEVGLVVGSEVTGEFVGLVVGLRVCGVKVVGVDVIGAEVVGFLVGWGVNGDLVGLCVETGDPVGFLVLGLKVGDLDIEARVYCGSLH